MLNHWKGHNFSLKIQQPVELVTYVQILGKVIHFLFKLLKCAHSLCSMMV